MFIVAHLICRRYILKPDGDGCLKPRIVVNTAYTMFFLYIPTNAKV